MFPIRDDVPASRLPIVMWMLIAANVVIFALMLRLVIQGAEPQVERLLFTWGVIPVEFTNPTARAEVAPRQYMALFTSMFIHGGVLHILLNMWFLWIFGDNVEDQMGHGTFLAFYVICGLAASAVHVAVHPNSSVPTVGASGAISGVVGAYVLLFPMARVLVLIPIIIIPLFVTVPAFVFIGIWFLLQFLSGTATLQEGAAEAAGVAFWAHIGGFVAGMALCPLLAHKPADSGGG